MIILKRQNWVLLTLQLWRGEEERACVCFLCTTKIFYGLLGFCVGCVNENMKNSTELINYGTHFFFNSSFLMKYYITVYLIINIFQHFHLLNFMRRVSSPSLITELIDGLNILILKYLKFTLKVLVLLVQVCRPSDWTQNFLS